MSNTSASTRPNTSTHRTARILEGVALAGLALIIIQIVLVITGPSGLDIRPSAGNFGGSDAVMGVRAEPDFAVDFGDRFEWVDTDDGTRDAATGMAPVELTGPVEATLSFWDPPRSQRTIWTIRELLGPIVAGLGAWVVYRLVRSVRQGDPFNAANERRLWQLAAIVGIGGTIQTLVGDFLKMLLIQRSAAADLFPVTMTLNFLPLILAALIGVLAGVWRIGVTMREDVEATI